MLSRPSTKGTISLGRGVPSTRYLQALYMTPKGPVFQYYARQTLASVQGNSYSDEVQTLRTAMRQFSTPCAHPVPGAPVPCSALARLKLGSDF